MEQTTTSLKSRRRRALAGRKLTLGRRGILHRRAHRDRLDECPRQFTLLRRGVVTYSDESKTHLLGVPAALIAQHGAVSKEVAEAWPPASAPPHT